MAEKKVPAANISWLQVIDDIEISHLRRANPASGPRMLLGIAVFRHPPDHRTAFGKAVPAVFIPQSAQV